VNSNRAGEVSGESSLTTSAKPVGFAAVSPVRIKRADNFGLPLQGARPPDASLCVRMKSWLRFWNWYQLFAKRLAPSGEALHDN